MTKSGEQLLAKVLKLSPTERAEIVEDILSSFDFPFRKKVDKIWAKEAENRIDALEQGKLSTVSAEKVFKKVENLKK